jgi:hypothetical protein
MQECVCRDALMCVRPVMTLSHFPPRTLSLLRRAVPDTRFLDENGDAFACFDETCCRFPSSFRAGLLQEDRHGPRTPTIRRVDPRTDVDLVTRETV